MHGVGTSGNISSRVAVAAESCVNLPERVQSGMNTPRRAAKRTLSKSRRGARELITGVGSQCDVLRFHVTPQLATRGRSDAEFGGPRKKRGLEGVGPNG